MILRSLNCQMRKICHPLLTAKIDNVISIPRNTVMFNPSHCDQNRKISTSLPLQKIRKQVKDKAKRKDPALRLQEQIRLGGHIKKFDKKKAARRVEVWRSMSLQDLATVLDRDIDQLFELVLGLPNTDYIQSELQPLNNMELVRSLAGTLNFSYTVVADPTAQEKRAGTPDRDAHPAGPAAEADLVPRPPVVTIMGHIDHGKTSLLDWLRQSRIVAGEHGGITQHIGAFSVTLESGQQVTFIDTPGHAAFTAMRTRGATSTDIVILIIDAVEGVLEQTLESLRIIRQARVPFLVAINKIDRAGAAPGQVRQQLAGEGVLLEEEGGEVPCVEISALHGTNVRQLVETLATQAEVLELKSDPAGTPEGVVVESQLEAGLGKTATVLLQRGTLRPGAWLVAAGPTSCKVRLLLSDTGERLAEVLPGQAAKVVGWREAAPPAGSRVLSVASEARAREVVRHRTEAAMRARQEQEEAVVADRRQAERAEYIEMRTSKRELGFFRPKLGTFGFNRVKETEEKSDNPVVSVLVKGDVDGSVEAILSCLETYQQDVVKLDIVDFGVGPVTETDISMAESFNAVIYAFNTAVPDPAREAANRARVPIRPFNVIYHLVADLKQELASQMPPAQVETVLGRATVLQQFTIKEKKEQVAVAGCRMVAGKLNRAATVRLVRAGETLYQGEVLSLKHLKEEVGEVELSKEFGLRLPDPALAFEPGDTILAVETRQEPGTVDWDPGF